MFLEGIIRASLGVCAIKGPWANTIISNSIRSKPGADNLLMAGRKYLQAILMVFII
jgi:hypothetical protein